MFEQRSIVWRQIYCGVPSNASLWFPIDASRFYDRYYTDIVAMRQYDELWHSDSLTGGDPPAPPNPSPLGPALSMAFCFNARQAYYMGNIFRGTTSFRCSPFSCTAIMLLVVQCRASRWATKKIISRLKKIMHYASLICLCSYFK